MYRYIYIYTYTGRSLYVIYINVPENVEINNEKKKNTVDLSHGIYIYIYKM